jgi:outer membrane receptor protein involved in Fe transport
VGGLTGDFNAGERQFGWDLTVNYGRSTSSTASRELVNQNFYNALNAVSNANGQITCAPGYTSASYPTISSTCAPLNIFGYGNASQAAINYITANAYTHQVNSQLDVQADVKGDLIKLPGGYLKGVAGYEYRRESAFFDPGAFFRGELQSDGSYLEYGGSVPITPVSGKFHTNEFFGELNAPVISPDNEVPFISSLDLNAAVRYVKHSLTGGFTSYTGGGTYAPVKGLTIRGNFTRSFRAPAITELFAPNGSTFELANDPCDQRFIAQGNNPAARAANCAAAGVPANFTSVVDATAKGTTGGNPNLQNETANSWTLGGVLQPQQLRGLQISADYVNIDIRNEIASLSLTDLMSACYDSSLSSPFCSTFTRDSSGQVTTFAAGNFNIGQETFRALQGNLKYNLPLERLGLSASAGCWISTSITCTPSGITTASARAICSKSWACRRTRPTPSPQRRITRANPSTGWCRRSIMARRRSIPLARSDYQYPIIHSYVTFNSSIGVDATKNINFRFLVNNVFNRGLPFPTAGWITHAITMPSWAVISV